jgi:formate-dependent nitrite reductase membrane component NrfD
MSEIGVSQRRRKDGGERRMVPGMEPRSYYGRPVIKAPVWKPEIPWYFFTGGLTGASTMLAFAAGLFGNRVLARRAWLNALAGVTVSPALLTADLGRPERFINMLRVFKVTSPMSMGSWTLAAIAPAAAVAAGSEVLGVFPRLARVARPSAAVLGLPLATYTAALISNTAVPAWHEARHHLPFVFAGGAAASAGAAATLFTPSAEAAPARRLAVGGSALGLAAMQSMEHHLGELAEPYRQGAAGRYGRLAKILTTGGAATIGLAGRRTRSAAAAGSAMVLAGAVLERWAIFKAGFQSARDPHYTIDPQRARVEERTAALGGAYGGGT